MENRIETRGNSADRISRRQFLRMVMIELFSTTSLILPALTVRLGGKGGLLPLLWGSAMALVLAAYYLWISEGWEQGYGRQILLRLGKWGSGFYMVVYCLRFFLHGLFLMVLFSALIQEVLLPDQSIGLILLPVLILTFYATRKNLSVRARTLELLFYYIFIPLLLVLLLALFQVDYGTLPHMLWGEQAKTKENLFSAYGILMTYTALEFILFLCPVAKEGKRERGQERRKEGRGFPLGKACLFVILLNVLIYIVTVGMFGTVRTGRKLWSALYIMQNVRLPGHFLERLDILFLAFWIFSVFALFSGYLFYSESIVRQWTGLKKTNWIYPAIFLAGIFFLAVAQPNPEKILFVFSNYMMWIDFPLAVLLPLLVRLIRRGQGEKIKKVGAMLLLLVMCTLTFTGCESRVDLEDKNYILALGIDAGKEKEFSVSYGTANLNQPTGEGEGGDQQKGEAVSYEASSLKMAEEKDQKSDEKKLDYGHLKAILFSKEVCKNPILWKKMVKELGDKSNLAGTVLVFQVDGTAKDCLKLEKYLGDSLGDYLDRMMANHKRDGRKEYTLGELLRDEAEGQTKRKIPMLKPEEKKIVFID